MSSGSSRLFELRTSSRRPRRRNNVRRTRQPSANFSWMLYRDHIDTRLGQLEKKERVTFDGWSDRRELYENLERKIKPLIISEILKDSNIPVAQLKERIAALVDRHYREFCD